MSAALLDLLFPARCVCCGAVVPRGQPLCPDCGKNVARVEEPVCLRCGRGRAFCRCRGRHYAFSAAAAPLYYEGAVRKGVARFKFRGRRAAASGFAQLALPAVRRTFGDRAFDAVTAVPLSRAGLAARGYNQSALFGRELAKRLDLPYTETLRKGVDVKPQHTCGATERWGNVFGVFEVCGDVSGKRLLLADDILTTGATLHECARMLCIAGAAEVGCAVIACVR